MAHERPFRFGAGCFRAGSGSEYAEQARRIEAQGYATLLIADHFVGQLFAPGPALTAAALATTSLRVGTTVYAADYRHPVVLAQEAASIDVLSDGHMEMGLGAGWSKGEYEQIGIPFDPAGIRVDRMQEALRVVRGLWCEQPFSYSGDHYTITEVDGWPRPVQQPGPPIFIGAGGKRMLSFAAREADIVGILAKALPAGDLDTPSDTEQRLAEKAGWIRDAAGDRFAAIELAMLIWAVRVTDDARAGAEDIARTRHTPTKSKQTTPEQILASPYYLIGSVEQIVERLHELRERYGVSYFSVFPKEREALAPIVARLAGA